MSFLDLERLEKTFSDGTQAVKGIDLGVERGELVVLLGPSGCGKTTTLRMIAGLELPTGGAIRLDGREVTRLRPSERDVGFVFQFYALYPHLSVRENVEFPLLCAGVAAAERRAAVERVARRLALEELLERRPRQLSGGDQQRVALARAMVRRPAVYLMDEPLGTLDSDRRLELCELIRAQQLELQVTTIYVTHDQEEAMRLADRIVVMSEGRILQAAPPATVYDDPATLFVAQFVGSPGMNFLRGEIDARGGARAFRHGEAEIALPRGTSPRPGPAVLGVRPEFVRVDPSGPLRGTVRTEEYLGAARCLHLDTPLGRIVARVSAGAPRRLGEEIALGFDPAHVRLFEPSGARLA